MTNEGEMTATDDFSIALPDANGHAANGLAATLPAYAGAPAMTVIPGQPMPHVAPPVPQQPDEVVLPGARPNGVRGAIGDLDARSISAWFGDHKVLDRVSLHMPSGEVTALIGPSGCGKSTFLRTLNRMHELIPSASLAGEVLLDGQDIYAPDRRLTEARRQIGMVFQRPNPFPAMSIYDNVIAGLKLTGKKASTAEKDGIVETHL